VKHRRLGKSDLYVSEVGFGCMSIGKEESQAIRLIHEALANGVNFLDTADLYDQGLNETFVGKAIAGRRSEVIIATKVGNRFFPGKPGWLWEPSKLYIKETIKDSLKRLNTDYIDLYQLHGGTMDDPMDEVIEAFEELRQEGLIRYYGMSSIRPNVIREYVKRSNMVSVMMQYSIIDRRPEESVIPFLADHEISVIARGPLSHGTLSGKLRREDFDGILDYSVGELAQLVDMLQKMRDEEHPTPSDVALRYPLASPVVASVIPGASKIEHVRDNTRAGDLPELTGEKLELVRKTSKPIRYKSNR
jgi:1-deoxyxylulose-5-phosphate synthase